MGLDIVKFDGLRSKDWLIYKYPSDTLMMGGQLIVQEGQVAIFARGGALADVFYPGTYTLKTENLPILRGLVNLPFGGRTPFSAEVYYINTTVKLDINWGTIDPIQLIDPKYHVKLRVRAFGQMGLRVRDVTGMFREVIGGLNKDEWVRFDRITEYYKGILVMKVKSAIANAIISEGISALEIDMMLDRLSEQVKFQIAPEFERYGFSVTNFFIQSINFPDEDFDLINSILTDRAAFDLMGDERYAMKRSFDVYEGAANNQNGVAGAFVAGGMGIGAGMGMGAAMGQTMGNPMMVNNQQGRGYNGYGQAPSGAAPREAYSPWERSQQGEPPSQGVQPGQMSPGGQSHPGSNRGLTAPVVAVPPQGGRPGQVPPQRPGQPPQSGTMPPHGDQHAIPPQRPIPPQGAMPAQPGMAPPSAQAQSMNGEDRMQGGQGGQNGPMKECPSCHAMLPVMAKFCFKCGAKAEEEKQGICKGCGCKLVPGAKFCFECGRKVD